MCQAEECPLLSGGVSLVQRTRQRGKVQDTCVSNAAVQGAGVNRATSGTTTIDTTYIGGAGHGNSGISGTPYIGNTACISSTAERSSVTVSISDIFSTHSFHSYSK